MKRKQLIFAALLGALSPILAPQGANAQPAVPAQAAAAGMNNLAFDDEFTSNTLNWSTGSTTVAGAKWYPYDWDAATSGGTSLAVGTGGASGTLTLTDGCIATCPTYPNTALALPPGTFKHFYAEARLQFPVNTGSTSGWPSFWSYGVSPGAPKNSTITLGECDFIEAIWTGNSVYPCNTIHNWAYTSSGSSSDTANTDSANAMQSLQARASRPRPMPTGTPTAAFGPRRARTRARSSFTTTTTSSCTMAERPASTWAREPASPAWRIIPCA